MDQDYDSSSDLSWANVALAFTFILFNAFLSTVLQLDIGGSLITAAVRCVVQLALVGTILQKVFEADNPWAVAAIAFFLNLTGTLEIVINKSKRRHNHIFSSVLVGLLGSTIPISIIGSRFAMSEERFWTPSRYIPVVGMLCGSTINAVVIALNYVLKEIEENRDRIETYLAFGASRAEATQPIAKEALRFALTPVINQMSVIGIIAIPGMMTGAILGGSSVTQAAKLQMIIMFLISSSTALASIACTTYAISTVVDGEHRVRSDKVYGNVSWPSVFHVAMAKVRRTWKHGGRGGGGGRPRTDSQVSLLPLPRPT
ncbi:hypothetical protein L218DRAFT_932813 [Marasmius fiardii PR-910]|nr:hypothetical protein L218DRAFT_932813 [Marasmius fiardii PR-910]